MIKSRLANGQEHQCPNVIFLKSTQKRLGLVGSPSDNKRCENEEKKRIYFGTFDSF
jgi:hypothetical protein